MLHSLSGLGVAGGFEHVDSAFDGCSSDVTQWKQDSDKATRYYQIRQQLRTVRSLTHRQGKQCSRFYL